MSKWLTLSGGLLAWVLSSQESYAEGKLLAPVLYSGMMAGDILSQEGAKHRGALEMNPLHSGSLEKSLAFHLGGTALLVYGDSKLPKKWQKWTLRVAYALWTGYKVKNNMQARRIEVK
jgi:hypothetical protein